MGGLGDERRKDMYHYFDDKELLHKMRRSSGEIMQSLCHFLKEDYDIGANFYLVGSGAKKLILQNAKEPVDLDYNLEIVRCEDFENCRHLKECVRKSFNKALQKQGRPDCEDSTSSLTSKKQRYFYSCNQIDFSIDICITKKDEEDHCYRLIHEKTGWTVGDKYYWNMAPCSKEIQCKAKCIKSHGKWELVREQYLELKNRYLQSNDHHHPSFICYMEAVNNVYEAESIGRNEY